MLALDPVAMAHPTTAFRSVRHLANRAGELSRIQDQAIEDFFDLVRTCLSRSRINQVQVL
jgi:hypothetical protein